MRARARLRATHNLLCSPKPRSKHTATGFGLSKPAAGTQDSTDSLCHDLELAAMTSTAVAGGVVLFKCLTSAPTRSFVLALVAISSVMACACATSLEVAPSASAAAAPPFGPRSDESSFCAMLITHLFDILGDRLGITTSWSGEAPPWSSPPSDELLPSCELLPSHSLPEADLKVFPA